MPKRLLGAIDELAGEDNRSRSNWIVTELTAAVRQRGRPTGGKTAEEKPTHFSGRVVPDVPLKGRQTGSQPSLNEDAPKEIKPVIPARQPSESRVTHTRAALRKMREREHPKEKP